MKITYSNDNTLTLDEKNEIIVQKCPVTEHIALHRHSFIEIAYIDSGIGVHEIEGGNVSRVEKGDLVLFNPGVLHGYRVEKPETLTVYNCLFDPSVLGGSYSGSDDFIRIVYDFLFEAGETKDADQRPYIQLHGAEQVSDIIKEMFREYNSRQNGYKKINIANLIRLLITIFRLKIKTGEGSESAYKTAVAENSKRYINAHFQKKISCDDLAGRAYVSTGYFYRIFKKATGMTPVQYIQSVRLEEAARLLKETPLPVSEVAESVGYSDLKYFYELFVKRFGVRPGEYRAQR